MISQDLHGRDKVTMAIQRLQMFEPPEGYFLADSGGKDSCCILELAKMAGVKFEAVYNVTTIDPPELVQFIRKHHPETRFSRPTMPFLRRLLEKGFPIRTKRWCCAEYKERSGSGRRVVTGIRWQESNRRKQRKMVEHCFRDKSKIYVNPIIDWSGADVWSFIRQHKIPYCSLYDEGFKRLGCVMCPMNRRRKSEAKRWPKMERAFRRAFVKLYETHKGRPSYTAWQSGDEMFDWWLSDKPSKKDSGQVVMFE